jgi:hypothetical protein
MGLSYNTVELKIAGSLRHSFSTSLSSSSMLTVIETVETVETNKIIRGRYDFESIFRAKNLEVKAFDK